MYIDRTHRLICRHEIRTTCGRLLRVRAPASIQYWDRRNTVWEVLFIARAIAVPESTCHTSLADRLAVALVQSCREHAESASGRLNEAINWSKRGPARAP